MNKLKAARHKLNTQLIELEAFANARGKTMRRLAQTHDVQIIQDIKVKISESVTEPLDQLKYRTVKKVKRRIEEVQTLLTNKVSQFWRRLKWPFSKKP